MNLLDFVILATAFMLADRGRREGLLRQVGSLGGFAVGLVLGAVLAPVLSGFLPVGPSKVVLLLTILFGTAALVGGFGQALGMWLSRQVHERRFGSIDRIFGIIFGVGATLTAFWLLAATFARTGGPMVVTQIQTSVILRQLDQRLPPAPDVLTRLENSLGAAGLPRVFVGLEPTPPPPVTGPNADAINAATVAATPSMVRVEGLGCGGILEGSGFVVGPELVMTNAHVIAGIRQPVVQNSTSSYRGTVVLFNPKLDVAIMRVPGLQAPALALAPNLQARGTVGAVLGYPGGGKLATSPAAILDVQTALGRDIYGSNIVSRQVYELQSLVRQGNSGGPFVAPGGSVLGLVFAASATTDSIGYSITSVKVAQQLAAVNASSPAVSTGPCLAN